jgi:glutathione synthase/RimK-type ligase-like ATP-grasp enzyme
MRPQVLVVTYGGDRIDRVVAALQAEAEVVRLDTDRLGADAGITIEQGAEGPRLAVHTPARVVLDRLRSVWYRRSRIGHGLPAGLTAADRLNAQDETRHALEGLIALSGAFVMDPVAVLRQAGHKPLQLRLAAALGLAVPRTLHTNRPEAARAFVGDAPERHVTKVLTSFSVSEGGRESVVHTSALAAADLADLDGLRLAPGTFQERVPKALELRVTIVGAEAFACAVDSQAEPGAEVDWRRRGHALAGRWRPYDLPADVREGLLALTARLGLTYGAADLVLTPDGRHVFLEINPAGQFLDQDAVRGGAISAAIARRLLAGAPADPR